MCTHNDMPHRHIPYLVPISPSLGYGKKKFFISPFVWSINSHTVDTHTYGSIMLISSFSNITQEKIYFTKFVTSENIQPPHRRDRVHVSLLLTANYTNFHLIFIWTEHAKTLSVLLLLRNRVKLENFSGVSVLCMESQCLL